MASAKTTQMPAERLGTLRQQSTTDGAPVAPSDPPAAPSATSPSLDSLPALRVAADWATRARGAPMDQWREMVTVKVEDLMGQQARSEYQAQQRDAAIHRHLDRFEGEIASFRLTIADHGDHVKAAERKSNEARAVSDSVSQRFEGIEQRVAPAPLSRDALIAAAADTVSERRPGSQRGGTPAAGMPRPVLEPPPTTRRPMATEDEVIGQGQRLDKIEASLAIIARDLTAKNVREDAMETAHKTFAGWVKRRIGLLTIITILTTAVVKLAHEVYSSPKPPSAVLQKAP